MNSHFVSLYNPEVKQILTCLSQPVNNFVTIFSESTMLNVNALITSLEHELNERAFLALRYDRNYGKITHEVRKQNNYEAMKFVERFCSEQEYIRRARLLGFRRRRTYSLFTRGGNKTVYQQAIDYVECLFNFYEYYFQMIKESEDAGIDREQFYQYLSKIAD